MQGHHNFGGKLGIMVMEWEGRKANKIFLISKSPQGSISLETLRKTVPPMSKTASLLLFKNFCSLVGTKKHPKKKKILRLFFTQWFCTFFFVMISEGRLFKNPMCFLHNKCLFLLHYLKLVQYFVRKFGNVWQTNACPLNHIIYLKMLLRQ